MRGSGCIPSASISIIYAFIRPSSRARSRFVQCLYGDIYGIFEAIRVAILNKFMKPQILVWTTPERNLIVSMLAFIISAKFGVFQSRSSMTPNSLGNAQ
jgi:hypothetical protein